MMDGQTNHTHNSNKIKMQLRWFMQMKIKNSKSNKINYIRIQLKKFIFTYARSVNQLCTNGDKFYNNDLFSDFGLIFYIIVNIPFWSNLINL